MDQRLDAQLVEEFPNLYRDRHGNPQHTCMCWGFSCSDGWFELIYDLSSKLETLILQLPEDQREHCKASQVKEKFGGLRFYMDGATKEMRALIREAEDLSVHICDVCGQKGKLRTIKGYMQTVCEEHANDRKKVVSSPQQVNLKDIRVLLQKDKDNDSNS